MTNSRKHILGTIGALVLVVLLVGCQSVPGETTAGWLLQQDVMNMIGMWEANEGGSNPPNVVDTRHVSLDGDKHVEIWVIDRNGTRIEYEVNFRPSPRGGTDFGVQLPGREVGPGSP